MSDTRTQKSSDAHAHIKDLSLILSNAHARKFRASTPSNKNRLLVLGSLTKKKLTPFEKECEVCQAICDLCTEILLFFIIFNSMKNTFPFMQINVSGIPSPTLFSIL